MSDAIATSQPAAKPEVILEPTDQEIASKVLKSFSELMAPSPEPPKPAADAPKPPDSTPAVDPLEDPKDLSPKAAEKFKFIKTTRDEWRTKAQAFEADKAKLASEMEALKKAAPVANPVELEELKKQVKEYDEQLRMLSIERHPKFKAHFDAAMSGAVKLAEEAVGKEHADKVKLLLRIPDGETRNEQLEALSGNLTPLQQGRLAAALVEVQKVERDRESELTKARDNYEKVVANDKAQSEQKTAAQKAQSESRLKESLTLAATRDAFKPIEGDAEQESRIKQYEHVVRGFHAGKLPDNLQSALPVMAMEALHQKTVTIPALQAELKKRDEIIASYTKSAPVATGGSQAATKTDPELRDGSKFLDAFKANNPANK